MACSRFIRRIVALNQTPYLFSSIQSLRSVRRTLFSTSATETKTNQSDVDQKTEAEQTKQDDTSEGDKMEITEKLENEIKKNEQLTKDVEEFKDKYRRALAETENVRQRMTKQIQDAKIFGIQGFCKDLLDIADVLNKATESVPEDQLNASNPHLKDLFEGLKMTESQLLKVFNKHGLVQINPVDEKFDPNFHEALFEVPTPDKEAGTVAMVQKIGYKLHERTIRPALVGVAKGT